MGKQNKNSMVSSGNFGNTAKDTTKTETSSIGYRLAKVAARVALLASRQIVEQADINTLEGNVNTLEVNQDEILSTPTINYYVKKTTGDDSKDGLTENTAFKTVDRALEVYQSYKNLYKKYVLGYSSNDILLEDGLTLIAFKKPNIRINVGQGTYFVDNASPLRESPSLEIKGKLIPPDFSGGSSGPTSGITNNSSTNLIVQVDGGVWNDNELVGFMIKFDGDDNYYPIRKNTDMGAYVEINLPFCVERSTGNYPKNTAFTLYDFGTTFWWSEPAGSDIQSRTMLINKIRHCELDFGNSANLDFYECRINVSSNNSGINYFLCYMAGGCKAQNIAMCVCSGASKDYTVNNAIHCEFDCDEVRFSNLSEASNVEVYGSYMNFCNIYGNTKVGKEYKVTPMRQSFSGAAIYRCYFYETSSIELEGGVKVKLVDNYFKDTFLGLFVKGASTALVYTMYKIDTGTIDGAYVFDIEQGSKVLYTHIGMQLTGTTNDYRINPAIVGAFAGSLLDASNGCLIQDFNETY